MTDMIFSGVSRRHFLVLGSATALAGGLAQPAAALTEAKARRLVDLLVGEINVVIASGRPLSSMVREFERIFRTYSDVNIIARSTLGATTRQMSNAQMSAFIEAFRGYIARKYGKRFNEFIGGRIEVKSVRPLKSYYEVKCIAYLRGEAPFELLFHVSDRSGKDLFFDMIIEGISLRLSERTEIGSMLDRRGGDINAMIADLRKAG